MNFLTLLNKTTQNHSQENICLPQEVNIFKNDSELKDGFMQIGNYFKNEWTNVQTNIALITFLVSIELFAT